MEQYNSGYQDAIYKAELEVKNKPYVVDAHYNLGMLYNECGRYMEAYEQYSIAEKLIMCGETGNITVQEIISVKGQLLNSISSSLENGTKEELDRKKHYIDYIVIRNGFDWEVGNSVFHDWEDVIGKDYMDYPNLEKMYIGISGLQTVYDCWCDRLERNTIVQKAEIQRVKDAAKYMEITLEKESYVPVVSEQSDNLLFDVNGNTYSIPYKSPLQFVNYRLPKGKIRICSQNSTFRMGKVVPVEHSDKRKRLVLNIFIDGLSELVLEENFAKYMPNTYAFFNKGLICTNAYTAGDWTFPSIASVVTGQTMAVHKMLHSKVLRRLDIDTPLLFEYFQNAGYNTTKIGGNWRVAPNYGYARGMNRVYYQHMYEGYSAERVIADVEEQIYRMRDTDQFIWMELGELHLIADEVNMAPLQSECMAWENTRLAAKINSVKQEYDETKKRYYIEQIQYLDRRLAGLYQYIEQNYEDDEIAVSVFSDHGQGYLVKPGDRFLSEGRTKVAYMFRGGDITGKSEEIMSTCDYAGIMCRLAGVQYDYSNTDAQLPVIFGGEQQRQFSVTESIHVGDPYQIVLNGRDFKFYLRGIENVTSECRVPLDSYEAELVDDDGNAINDMVLKKYYTDWCLKHAESCII